MIRSVIEDVAELSGLALFLTALALIAAPDAAHAADGIASPGACLAWIIPALLGGAGVGCAICIVCALIYMRNAVCAFGGDVAEHDNNDIHAAERAESIKGE